MCRSCGAIVGAGETQCAVCGASTATQTTAHVGPRAPDRETIRFARAVLNRPYKFTIAVLVGNLFVFLLVWESGGLTVAALHHADVCSHRHTAPRDEHVQLVDTWTICREALRFGEVCCVLRGDWYCGHGGELSGAAAVARSRLSGGLHFL